MFLPLCPVLLRAAAPKLVAREGGAHLHGNQPPPAPVRMGVVLLPREPSLSPAFTGACMGTNPPALGHMGVIPVPQPWSPGAVVAFRGYQEVVRWGGA
ncbi:MAG: hypothetical protein OHK0015_18090 [Chloroflexi bacterium OHK40]